jgi:Leucine-rich repeat (LRR) protein
VAIGALVLAVGWGCGSDPTGSTDDPFCSSRPAQTIVAFEDANLEAAVREAILDTVPGDLTCGLVQALTVLRAGHLGISSLEGLQNLIGLSELWIRGNSITDVGQLRGLTNLTSLNLAANSIADISALSGLTRLQFLAINENEAITDISPLRGLTDLTGALWIHNNSITDISPLSGLTKLTTLNAWENSITDISALSELTSLTHVRLHINSITDINALEELTNLELVWLSENSDLNSLQPLIDNVGLGAGVSVNVSSTNVACSDVNLLQARGVAVISDCP